MKNNNLGSAPSTCAYTMNAEISKMYWKLMRVEMGNVLDIGSGQGGFGLSKPSNVKLFGIERDKTIIDQSKNYCEIKHMEIDNNFKMPFDDNYFTGVLARDILEHIEKPWLVLDEIYKGLISGGVIICSVPKPDPKIVWNDYTHIRGFTKTALASMVRNSGFEIISLFPLSGYRFATKLGLVNMLPTIAKIPPINRFMVNFHCIAVKP
jgi:SAM-dependent methyltransferase